MTEGTKDSRADLVNEFQRWLFRSGARGMRRELGDHFRAVVGRSERTDDVWESATAEPPPGEAAECAWCPVCRAARMLRESSPGLAAQVTTAGDLLTAVAQDVMSAVESALASTGRAAGPGSGERTAGTASAWDKAGDDSPQAEPADGGSDPAGPSGSPPHGPDHRG